MPTPLTKRQKIVNAVVDRLKTVLKTNGYLTDAGKNVFYWRTGKFSQEELSGMTDGTILIRDIDETKAVDGDGNKEARGIGTQKFKRDLHMQIELSRAGSDSPDTVHQLIADIETAIGKDVRWKESGGTQYLALGTRPRLDRSVVEQETLKASGVIYEFFICYVTDAFNPFQ